MAQPYRQTSFLCRLRLRHLFRIAGLVGRQAWFRESARRDQFEASTELCMKRWH